jgi:hypothetical protein
MTNNAQRLTAQQLKLALPAWYVKKKPRVLLISIVFGLKICTPKRRDTIFRLSAESRQNKPGARWPWSCQTHAITTALHIAVSAAAVMRISKNRKVDTLPVQGRAPANVVTHGNDDTDDKVPYLTSSIETLLAHRGW